VDATLTPTQRSEAGQLKMYLKLLAEAFPGCLVPKGRGLRIKGIADLAKARALYTFCKGWVTALQAAGEKSNSTPMFLAWQTYENLRFMVFGFEEFCESYLKDHPGNYLVPGLSATSGLESMFGHAKGLQNGNLCAVNFAGTLARIGVLRNVALGPVKKSHTGRWQLVARVEARAVAK